MKLLYLAKPNYGGWVTFSANLAKINKTYIVKLGKRTETTKDREKNKIPKYRDFGYGIKYRNFLLNDLLKDNDDDIIICAIDKNYHHYLELLPLDKVTIVIHDPTEIKSKKNFILPFLPKMKKVITIRKLVKTYLDNLKIPNTFYLHPYLENKIDIDLTKKKGSISISRIDWDKHTDILLKTNKLLEKDKIDIYGDKNDRYVFNKLKDIDSCQENDETSCYCGRFPKNTDFLEKILKPKKFMIDLSRIKNDGGGTQYTFLEAINSGCCLILNRDWVNVKDSIWKEGVNCLSVSNEFELKQILETDSNYDNIIKNANKILENHQNFTPWIF